MTEGITRSPDGENSDGIEPQALDPGDTEGLGI
jgi:hypothetical protein